MAPKPAVAVLTELAAKTDGVFRGIDAVARGITRDQLAVLRARSVIERVLPDTYALAGSRGYELRAALLWAGEGAAATDRSAAMVYELDGVRAPQPEIVVTRRRSPRHPSVSTATSRDPESLMIRSHRGLRVIGPEATLVRLAHVVDGEALEVASEDARRRHLTTVPALRAYLDRFGRSGRPGVATMRSLLDELDPVHPSRSRLEVLTRRLLVAHGVTDFEREFPLKWNGRAYQFDFAFHKWLTILETNGRRWHDDPKDYEYDHEKWSVPARYGYKLVFATWDKVRKRPRALLDELRAAFASSNGTTGSERGAEGCDELLGAGP